MAMSGKLGAVYRINGASVALTNEATTADTSYKRYTITTAAKRYLDDSAAVTVKKNGATITTGFKIEYAGGVVVFNAALLPTDVITVTGKYFNITQCTGFFEWTLDAEADIKEVTTFNSAGWAEYATLKKGWTAAANGYWADGTFAGLLNTRTIIVFYIDQANNKRYEGYLFIKKNSVKVPANDIVEESLDIQGDGPLYYHE
jgi:hypothetical protein